jgi:hypothetical protein
MAKVGQPRKIDSPEHMEQLWNEYKDYCNSYTVTKTEFSAKEGRFISDIINTYSTKVCPLLFNFNPISHLPIYLS